MVYHANPCIIIQHITGSHRGVLRVIEDRCQYVGLCDESDRLGHPTVCKWQSTDPALLCSSCFLVTYKPSELPCLVIVATLTVRLVKCMRGAVPDRSSTYSGRDTWCVRGVACLGCVGHPDVGIQVISSHLSSTGVLGNSSCPLSYQTRRTIR